MNNPKIIDFLQIKYNKPISKITKDEIEKLNLLAATKNSFSNEKKYDLNELLLFPNLEYLSIEDSIITQEDINIISKIKTLKQISFTRCYIKPNIVIEENNIENISLKNCYINDLNIISKSKKLSTLQIYFPSNDYEIDINDLNFQSIKQLSLDGCIINNINNVKKLKNLEILTLISSIFGNDFSFLGKTNIKKLYISDEIIKAGKYGQLEVLNDYSSLLMDDETYSKNIV